MTARRTLGQRLAAHLAIATAVGMGAVFALGMTIWALTERGHGESAGQELVEQLAPLAVVAALGVTASVLVARWIARRATARIDHVVATATRVDVRDLSVRLPVAGHHDELAVALNRMLARIEAGVAAQHRFAADASHELRTPLTAAISALEVALRRPRTVGEWGVCAEQTVAELRHMSKVVDALLALARTELRGAVAAEPVIELVERVRATIAARAEPAIEVDVPEALAVLADGDAIAIALGNLVANALAHSPPSAPVSISAARDGRDIRIDVVDRGPGVPVADRARIFEPFARGAAGSADRVAHGAGVGLGLTIARRIAETYGGSISVDDAPGSGARFTLRLPAA